MWRACALFGSLNSVSELALTINNTSRAATQVIAGFLAQMTLCALRWVKLPPTGVLVSEGFEDIDQSVVEGGVEARVEESVKALAGKLSARDEAVYETIANFADGYLRSRRDGVLTTFVFTTSAAQASQALVARRPGPGPNLALDILKAWRKTAVAGDAETVRRLASEIRTLLTAYILEGNGKSKALRKRTSEALDGLDRSDEWLSFIRSVQWDFVSPDLDRPALKLEQAILENVDGLPGGAARQAAAKLLADELIMEVLRRSTDQRIDQRRLTRNLMKQVTATVLSDQAKVGKGVLSLRSVALANWRTQVFVVGRSPTQRSVAVLFVTKAENFEQFLSRELKRVGAVPGVTLRERTLLQERQLFCAVSSSPIVADRLGEILVSTSALYFVGLADEPAHASARLDALTRNRLSSKRVHVESGRAAGEDLPWALTSMSQRTPMSEQWPVACEFARLVAEAFEEAGEREFEPSPFTARIQPNVKLLVDSTGKPHRQESELWAPFNRPTHSSSQ